MAKIKGTKGDDLLEGTTGDDVMLGLGGNDEIYSGDGNDILRGGAGDDVLNGRRGNDQLFGDAGDDRLVVSAGRDKLDGGKGFDGIDIGYSAVGMTLALDAGKLDYSHPTDGAGRTTFRNMEDLWGTNFSDRLTGDKGSNWIAGRMGDDTIIGGKGDDILEGGLGADTLTGGKGRDMFVFNTALSSADADVITDLEVGRDAILLDAEIFTALAAEAGGARISNRAYSATEVAASQIEIVAGGGATQAGTRLVYDSDAGTLSYDADGSGAGASVLVARIGTGHDSLADTIFLV